MNLQNLHNQISEVAPIHGVSIGKKSDKTTWLICFTDEATDEEKAAAQTILNNWNEETEEEALKQPFKDACIAFRGICNSIETLLLADGALVEGETFTGGFDEMATFKTSTSAATLPGITLGIQWLAANETCIYEGKKLGLGQPEWWHKCWEYANEE